jgi:2-methylcitrate dehydratase PrpD
MRSHPPELRSAGVPGVLNFVGCALGGALDEAVGFAVKVLGRSLGHLGIVIGRDDHLAALDAAFLNAVGASFRCLLARHDRQWPAWVCYPAGLVL